MKHTIRLLWLFLLLYANSLLATNYYVKSGGNNSLSGTSIANAWATIDKVNSFTGFAAGDVINFEGGSTFFGTLRPNHNGVAGQPIVFTSYGTGRATISGFATLTGFTSLGSNIWETGTLTLPNTCNILTINNVPQHVGRTPNSTFYVYSSASSSQLTSSSLSSAISYVGAEVVMRCNAFVMQRMTITAQSGSTVTYARTALGIDNNNPKGAQSGSNNYGFFLQRAANTLDIQGEWYYNPTTHKMRIYSTSNPSGFTIKASTTDTLVVLGSRSYLTFDNLAFEGAGVYAISGSYSSTGNLVVKNCSFNNNTRAVNLWNCFASYVIHNTINNSFNVGILVINRQDKQMTIDSNTVTNTGLLVGNGLFPSAQNLNGIVTESDNSTSNNFCYIRRNVVRSVGYMGIKFKSSNTVIRHNITDSMCKNIDDGGGIYSFNKNDGTSTEDFANRLVDSNFISNAVGAAAGTTRSTIDVVGLYLDDQVNFVNAYHNSIWNIGGNAIQLNNPKSIRVRDNTVYNSTYPVEIKTKQYGTVSGNFITKNIFYQKINTQWNFLHSHPSLSQPPPTVTITQSLQSMAYIDSNWITNTKTSGYSYNSNGGSGPITLSTWRSTILHDLVSILPPTTVTNTNTNFYTNASDTVRIIRFDGLSKVDPKGIVYNNLATVPQWSSLILIDNGNSSGTNEFPIANAGANQTITTPASTATLNGSASSDPDGTIILYNWVQLSGPSASTIAAPSSPITGVSGLVAGIYQYQLTVTDNNSATATSLTRVTVNVPTNTPPTANAGIDQTKVLPTNTATLTGSGSDPDGTIVSYAWTKVSGPTGGAITSPTSASTGITALQQGTYAFKLTVTDNGGLTGSDIMNIVVNPANIAPMVNAGADQQITLPDNSLTLSGSATDADGTIASYLWTKISGPTGGTISSPSTAITDITSLQEGSYVFKLTATDNNGATGSDFVQVVVNPVVVVNTPPVANAGFDTSITLPTSTATLRGSGVDPDGTIVSYAWVKISGPTGGTITSPSSAISGVTALQVGTYSYKLTVTDNMGLTGSDFVQIIVNPAANVAPTANAGLDQVLTLPTNSTTFTGSGSDPDGSIVSYAWAKVSGPTGGTISSPTTATTGITALQEGTYVYRLTVTDNGGLSGVDFIQVVVNPAVQPPNNPPTANAGTDQLITLPTNSTTLTGSGTDTDGTITGYAWVKISGPSGGTITSPSAATTGITALQEGVYAYRLTVTDNNGATGSDFVQITVNPIPPNTPPTADAGTDTSITLPTNSITLTGTGTDVDGTIIGYSWIKISGPTGGAISSPTSASTIITSLQEGTYAYQLTVTDNNGATGSDFVQIIVNAAPPNAPPIVNAGADTAIVLPTSSITLMGNAIDTDGVVTAYFWRQLSGPSTGVIGSPSSATTTISSLVQGSYIFQLRATDNSGDTATDAVQVTVNPANLLPIVNAGTNQVITLPQDTTTITATASDNDGTIVSTLWTKVSGPSGGNIASPSSLSTLITGMVEGVYIFKIKAIDDRGDSAVSSVQITVNPVVILTAPTANGGEDKILYLPTNEVTLTGTGTNGTGTIVSHQWTLFSGPSSGGDISNPDNYSIVVSNLEEGTYIYKLTVTDNQGLVGTDLVQVIVRPEQHRVMIILRGVKP